MSTNTHTFYPISTCSKSWIRNQLGNLTKNIELKMVTTASKSYSKPCYFGNFGFSLTIITQDPQRLLAALSHICRRKAVTALKPGKQSAFVLEMKKKEKCCLYLFQSFPAVDSRGPDMQNPNNRYRMPQSEK